jgi:hypothetical protein
MISEPPLGLVSCRARPSFSLPWQLEDDTQCAPQIVWLLYLLQNVSQDQVVTDTGFPDSGKFLCHPSPADSRPWAYFSEYDWFPFLLLVYCSPLVRAATVCDPSAHLTKTFLCLYSVFQSDFFMRVCYFLKGKKNSFGLRKGVSY